MKSNVLPVDNESDAPIEKLGDPSVRRGVPVREYLVALGKLHTYALTKNAFARFGFLWSFPLFFLLFATNLWASGGPFTPGVFLEYPNYFFVFLCPVLCTVVFGAMGTVRRRRDLKTARRVKDLERQIEDLAASNERFKELDRLKARFMTDVAHALQTPLAAIRGYNESILEERLGPITGKQRDGLGVAVRNIDRLQRRVMELLEFEGIERGDCRLELSDFDLAALIREVLDDLKPMIDKKPMGVRLRIPETLEVHADREKIGRVLLNLISNGFKFSPKGATMDVGAKASGDDGRILVTVWNHGPEIPIAAQKYLFSRFWQAEGSSRRKHGGIGLGLAIVKGILDAHGSSIKVVSSAASGTTVHFDLQGSTLEDPVKESNRDEQEVALQSR